MPGYFGSSPVPTPVYTANQVIHTIVFFQFTGEKAKGNWTRWFNSDNPFIYDEFAPGGDVETVQHQSWYKLAFNTEINY